MYRWLAAGGAAAALAAGCGHPPVANPATPLPAASPALARPPGTAFRTLSWNVGGTAFIEHPSLFTAVVRLADPDVVLLDEVTGEGSAEMVALALHGVRGPADTVWEVVYGAGGGYQRAAIAARVPVEAVTEFSWLAYSPQATSRLTGMLPDSSRAALASSLGQGVGANAAIVRLADRKVLTVLVDLWCCGQAGSPEDARRIVEAGIIQNATRAAASRLDPDGTIVAGDLNLVGSRTPLEILGAAVADAGDSLQVAPATHVGDTVSWTWNGGPDQPYPPARLDYALYDPTSLRAVRVFVLDTADLPTDLLHQRGLTPDASATLSDHRPVVVDYQWTGPPVRP